jgi:signal transduction histidine kinase/ligand-binding sensor domain-containing protein
VNPAQRSGYFLTALFWLGALSLAMLAQAQTSAALTEPYFESVGDSETIPEGFVTALAQDAHGWLWIGTQGGLVWHDGYRLRRFVNDKRNPHSLSGDFVRCLSPAPDGRIWVGTNGNGLTRFDPGSGRFQHFRDPEQDPAVLTAGVINALAGDGRGGVWLATDQGLDHLAAGATRFTHYRHEPARSDSLPEGKLISLLRDRQQRLWLGSTDGLLRLQPDGRGFERIAALDLAGHDITALFQASDGKLWLGTRQGGAAWLGPEDGRVHWLRPGPNGLSHAWVRALAEPGNGHIWIGTYGGGINIVNAGDGKPVQQLHHDPAITSSLALDLIGALLVDRAGLLLVGSWGGGLQRYNANNRAFSVLRHSPSRANGLSFPNVVSVLELQDGTIAVGTMGNGIDILDRKRGRVGGYRSAVARADAGANNQANNQANSMADSAANHPGNRTGNRPTHTTARLPDPVITALAQTPDGTLWAGTFQHGVVFLAPGARAWQAAPGLPDGRIRKMLVTRSGVLYVATGTGLARWQDGARGFVWQNRIDGQPLRFALFALAEDAAGRIWAGGEAGLWLLEPGTSGLQVIRHQAQRADSLAADQVYGLLADSRGRLWVSTPHELDRLLAWDGKQARFEHMSEVLNHPNLHSGANLLEDSQGRIWSQASLIDPAQRQIYFFSKADGFDIGTDWNGAYGQTRDGLLMYGGTQGMAWIEPLKFAPWNFQPQVVATELKINGQPQGLNLLGPASAPSENHGTASGIESGAESGTESSTDPARASRLVLSPGQRQFSLEFAALDYSAPNKNRYRYRLHPYDRDWIEADAEHRSVSYGNLWPGQYTLHVQGSNRLGQLSPQGLTVQVEVLPAFWQTGWFVLLLSVLLVASLWAGYRWRMQRVRSQAGQLQQMVHERTADLMQLAGIGRELTATLDLEQALARVHQHISARLDAWVFSIGVYDPAQQTITFIYEIENGQRHQDECYSMQELARPAVWCVRERRELLMEQNADLLRYVDTILPPSMGAAMETVVYLPLLLEQRIIGCFSVQSPQPHAYRQEQLDFLRALANYVAISLANALAHRQLADAHRHLQDTQTQLVQSEKMASIGALVANVAHEINTPISAVKASGGNISDALAFLLDALPRLFKILDAADEQRFLALIEPARHSSDAPGSREERAIRRQIALFLEQHAIANAWQRAEILAQLRAQSLLEASLPLLLHAQADFILKTAQGVAVIINNTNNIHQAVGRVSRIMFALRAFARTDGSGAMVAFDLRTGLETVLTIYQSQLRHGTQLVRDYHVVPLVNCLPDELNQVWINLIHNALQAMDYQGTLTVGLRQIGQEIQVAIGDTGCGIPDTIRDKIFEPFFTTKAAGEGSGLGLDIVRKIIDKHQGRIEVQSKVGQGTVFLIYLPLPLAPQATEPEKVAQ